MPDERSPQAVHLPLLIGEAFGRVPIPLTGLPDGVTAYTVPRKGADGQARVPIDRKKRMNPAEADLIGTRPTEAFAPPAELGASELRWILQTESHRLWSSVENELGQDTWPLVGALIWAGGVVIRCDVTNVKTWKPRTLRLTQAWAAQAGELREMRGLPVPNVGRSLLVALMAGIPELEDEAALLATIPGDAPLRGPSGSRTVTTVWTVYDAAIRAACYWYRHQSRDRRLTEREVAAQALGGSKEWTTAGKTAFEVLMGQPLDVLLDKAEHEIRVRGPLRWTVGSVVADAMTSYPWIGLPSGGIHLIGRIERHAAGVLVVENSDTFRQVCLRPDVTDRWLCVWARDQLRTTP